MSEDERMIGRVRPCSMTEEEAKAKCDNLGIELYDDSYLETLASETDDYCFLNKKFYEVLELKEKSIYGCNIRKDGNIIEFDAVYYNGGAHWTEVVEDAIEKL